MFQKQIIQFEDHFNDICFFVSNDLVLKYFKIFQGISNDQNHPVCRLYSPNIELFYCA